MGFFLRDNEFEKDLAQYARSVPKNQVKYPRSRKSDLGLAAIIGLWALYVLAVLAFWAGLIYIALHFILKFW